MHADGRSENGGESVVRAIILELGFAEPDLQVEIEDPLNPGTYKRVDYYWLLEDGRAIVGELDGFEKYLKTHGNPRKSPDENLRSAIKAMRREHEGDKPQPCRHYRAALFIRRCPGHGEVLFLALNRWRTARVEQPHMPAPHGTLASSQCTPE